jgi:hypothetical protein
MTREKRLSPRRAKSRLPLSPRQTRVRLKPLLFLRPLPPKVGTPRERDSLASAPFRSTPPFMLARARARSRLAGCRLCPTARLRRKSTVCGLNRFLPTLRVGALHLNPRPLFGALAPTPLCAVLKRQLRFRFGNKNCASAHFSLQNGIQKILRREGENEGQWPNRNGDGHSTKQITLITYYYEHQSHHHQR